MRSYLIWLDDPVAAVDQARADVLRAQVHDLARDPIERLHLAGELHAVEHPGPTLERAFVTHVAEWASAAQIPAEAFAMVGVSNDVLINAGLKAPTQRKPKRSTSTKRVRVSDVLEALPAGAFTMRSLQQTTGASMMTVRKAVAAGVEQHRVVDIGPDPEYVGPGRAPSWYRTA